MTPPKPQTSRVLFGGIVVALVALVVLGFVLQGSARTWWSVVVLGVVEGITEFLPISSTGHLLLTSKLIGFTDNIGGTFEIFIQLGAILAVAAYYARDLLAQARALPTSAETRRFWLSILVAFLPAAFIGLLLKDWIKTVLFDSPSTIAWSLIIGGIVLIAIERVPRNPDTTDVQKIRLPQALVIGLMQVLALVPGVSRSGSSMVGGMLAGLDRRTATAFSFYLALPTLGAATIVDLLGSLDQISGDDVGRLIVGTLVSMVVAWACISWLLRYVSSNNFVMFGIYRIAAGIAILALVATGVLA